MGRSRPERGLAPAHWDAELVTRLTQAGLTARGFLANASNHTLLVQVGEAHEGLHAVYKPRRGERPLWDFPPGTLCQREAAAWVVSDVLGWGLVPPTVLRDGPMGVGSVQLFVPHDPQLHYFALVDDPASHAQLARMATFDLLINNADRKGSHVLLSEDDERVVGIDHGVTFHPQPKLRTVIWDLGAARVEEAWRSDLRGLATTLRDGRHEVTGRLAHLLSQEEIEALCLRAGVLADLQRLPVIPADRRPYPWPPL